MKLRKSLHRRLSKSSKNKYSEKDIQQQLAKINSRELVMCQPIRMGVTLLNRPNHKSIEKTSLNHFDKLELSNANLDTLEDLSETFSKKNLAQKQILKTKKKFDYTFLNTLPISPITRTPALGIKTPAVKLTPAPIVTRISVNQTPPPPKIPIIRRKSLFNKSDFDSVTVLQTVKPEKKFVNRFQLGKPLGEGTYGKVYECVDTQTKKIYAIKQFSKNDIRVKKYISKEIHIMKLLFHENVVKYVQNCESSKFQYIVMEHCGVTNLKAYVKQRTFLSQSQARPMFVQLVHAIKYLHQKLIIHRDLKLQNVLINKDGKLKLIDFGFSQQLDSESQQLITYCGTPTYMCPQIIRKTPYGGFKADVWALGIILYYMVLGSFPFICRDEKVLFSTILRNPIPIDNNKFSLNLRNLLKGMLHQDRDKRFSINDIFNHEWLK